MRGLSELLAKKFSITLFCNQIEFKMETMRRSHLYEQLPYSQYEGEYEYPRDADGSPSARLLPLDALSLSEDGSWASGGAARSLKPNLMSLQLSGQSQSYQTPSHRRRENPLYQSISHIDAKSSDSRNPCDCFSTVSLVLTLVACLVSFASIGIAVHKNKAALPVRINHTYVEELETQLKSVLLKYDLLVKQMHEMKQEEIQSLNITYELLTNHSLVVRNEIYQEFHKLRADVGQEISNISRMPGPRGPPGLANMSSCKYLHNTGGGPSAMPDTTTLWIPSNATEANKYVITGVECSTTNGVAAFLNTSTANGFVQFQCRCFGSDHQKATSRRCTIHYWSCPVDN